MTNKQLILFASVFAALLAVPGLASAQEASDEGDAEETAETESDADEGEADEEAAVVADEEETAEAAPAEAAPAPAPEKPSPVQGTWTKKIEFASEDGMFKFQPTGFVQPKLQLLIVPDDDDMMQGSGFVFQRARMGFKAGIFKFARLNLDADFKTGTFGLIDYFADVDPWNGIFAVRAGRFRPWFGRQFMSATTQLQMIETAKAWTDDKLGLGMDRDLGVGVFGLIADTFEYGVGIWNGDGGSVFDPNPKSTEITGTSDINGDVISTKKNIDVMVGGRLAVHPLVPVGVGRAVTLGDESDSAISDKPGLALGVSAMFNKRHDRTFKVPVVIDGVDTDVDALYYDNQLKLGVDLAFQMKGLSFVGEFFLHKVWLASDAAAEIQAAIDAKSGLSTKGALVDGMGFGAYAQVGYFVIAKKLELAARFDMADESMDVRGSRLYPGFGASYYFFGNNLKVQLMYRLDMATGYGKITDASGARVDDPGYIPTGHDLFLMLQASI